MDTFPTIDASVSYISPEQLKARLDRGEELTLVDTRRPDDYAAWTLTHPNLTTINIPFPQFLDGEQPADEIPDAVPEGPLIISCAIGRSSEYVAAFLTAHGRDVQALEDGMEGWAGLLERYEIEYDGAGRLFQYHRPSSGCLGYLLCSGGEAAVIDPLRVFTDRYLDDVTTLDAELDYALDTHVHADHLSGVQQLAAASNATPIYPAGARERGLAADVTTIEDGDELTVGAATLTATALPGHTTEMMGYRVGPVLLTGDSLFLQSVARPDLEDPDRARSAAKSLYQTLTSLEALPAETIIAPGHASPAEMPTGTPAVARLGDIRQSLWAFRTDRASFVDRVVGDLPPRPNNYERIIALNLGQNTIADDEAFQLELGPNNCAVSTAD